MSIIALSSSQDFATTSQSSLPKKQKFRCLAISCFILLLILAILIPLTIFVIAPAIAESSISNAKMITDEMIISDPRSDGFKLTMRGSMESVSPLETIMEESELVMGFEGVPFATMIMPRQICPAGSDDIPLSYSTQVKITDADVYMKYSLALMNNESVVTDLHGIVNIKINTAGLWISIKNVRFRKSLSMKGMEGMKEMRLEEMEMPGEPFQNGGIELIVRASIFNGSPVTMPLGTPTFDVFYENVHLAVLQSSNMIISPGWNPVIMKGRILPFKSDNEEILSDYFSAYMNSLNSSVLVRGIQTDYQGIPIPWLNETIQSVSMKTISPGISEPFTAIGDMKILSMNVNFDRDESFLITNTAAISYTMPSNVKFKTRLENIVQTMEMIDEDGVIFATAIMSSSSISNDAENQATVNLQGRMIPVPEHFDQFSKFMEDQMTSKKASFSFQGVSNVTIRTATSGIMKINNLPAKKSVEIDGMDLKNQKPIIGDLKMRQGSKDILTVDSDVVVFNPANISVSRIGDLILDMFYSTRDGNEYLLGKVNLLDYQTSAGANAYRIMTQIIKTPENGLAIQEFMSNYGLGIDSSIRLQGSLESSTVKLLRGVFPALTMNSKVPGKAMDLTRKSYTYAISIPTTSKFDMYNPFDVPLTIHKLRNTSITQTGTGIEISRIENFEFDQGGLFIPPLRESKQEVCLSAAPDYANLERQMGRSVGVFEVADMSKMTNMDGVADISIDLFQVTVKYKCTNVPGDIVYWIPSCNAVRKSRQDWLQQKENLSTTVKKRKRLLFFKK